MRRMMAVPALLLAVTLAGPTMAGELERRCGAADQGASVSSEQVRSGLEAVGYRVDRIEAEHGCYEVRATNDTGLPVDAIYAGTSGELLGAKLR